MKIHDILNNLTENSAASDLKKNIINQVKKTDDQELLDKIYTVLNKSNLVDRIAGTLERETDTSGYVTDLTQLIIDTPGSYDEKYKFIEGFPDGYVNVQLMLSGERVRFKDLITGGKFVQAVFEKLKSITFGSAKGPGEFALAVLSPHIKITGKGDLNIGKMTVEVKANTGKSGGRLGTPGSLHYESIPVIISKNLKIPMSTLEGISMNLESFMNLLAQVPVPLRKKTASAVFNYIFGGVTDTSKLVSAIVNGDIAEVRAQYVKNNYEHYQKETNFDGIMLINFVAGELKYYVDPEAMTQDILSPNVYLISSNSGFSARQILSQVTLRAVKEPKLAVPNIGKSEVDANEAAVDDFVNRLISARGVDSSMFDQLKAEVLSSLRAGVSGKTIMNRLVKKFPELSPSAPTTQDT